MPFDTKRINGPEQSYSYWQLVEKQKKPDKIKGKREDGRKWDQARKFAAELGTVTAAKGSCYIENGDTKIICSVFELREVARSSKFADKGQLYCDFKNAPFSTETRKSSNENDEKLMASNIKKALESTVSLFDFPNYQIDIFIMVLEDDGSVLSTSIIAAGLALVNAGYPCYDLLTSSTISIVDGEYLIDPTRNEEEISARANHGTMTVSSLSSLEQIAQIQFKGFVDPNHIKEAKKHLLNVNEGQRQFLKSIIFHSKVDSNKS